MKHVQSPIEFTCPLRHSSRTPTAPKTQTAAAFSDLVRTRPHGLRPFSAVGRNLDQLQHQGQLSPSSRAPFSSHNRRRAPLSAQSPPVILPSMEPLYNKQGQMSPCRTTAMSGGHPFRSRILVPVSRQHSPTTAAVTIRRAPRRPRLARVRSSYEYARGGTPSTSESAASLGVGVLGCAGVC